MTYSEGEGEGRKEISKRKSLGQLHISEKRSGRPTESLFAEVTCWRSPASCQNEPVFRALPYAVLGWKQPWEAWPLCEFGAGSR